jgi:hypothetical protein
MLVPETAVDENREPVPGQNDVRLAREVAAVQPKAIAKSV